MRYISPTNLTYLDGAFQTLCLIIKMTLRNGDVRGFTDLDVDITVSSVLYRAKMGIAVSAMRWTNKLENEKTELRGNFSALTGGLTEAEAREGLYNEAEVEISLVRWDTAALVAPLKKGLLCNFTPAGAGYTAEVSSLAYKLSKKLIVEEVTFDCTAELGDARCTASAGFGSDGVITSWVNASSFVATGFFGAWGLSDEIIGGKLILIGTPYDWFKNKIKSFDSGSDTFVFWKPFPAGAVGGNYDFTAYLGCDLKPTTCKDRFNNLVNYRGFHFVPDKDETAIYVNRYSDDGAGYVAGSGDDD